jgi:NADPH-dependent glutamate synthase beta subunit-like oxidoreductase
VAPPRDLLGHGLEVPTLAHVAIIGGGIAGRATALFLARREHSVTVFDHERPWPTGDLDRDFFD